MAGRNPRCPPTPPPPPNEGKYVSPPEKNAPGEPLPDTSPPLPRDDTSKKPAAEHPAPACLTSAEGRLMRRSLVMEAALRSIPDPGSGMVRHLVKAFETLLSISDAGDGVSTLRKSFNWALPGLQISVPVAVDPHSGEETDPLISAAPTEFLEPKNFIKETRISTSIDTEESRLSWGSRTSSGKRRRRSRRNSSDSSGRSSTTKKLKVRSLHPFKLRTEQRGRLKEELFLEKVKKMIMDEQKKRIPIAKGLPWTTDEPEYLVKPPVKEPTEPVNLILHSDVRAIERAEFDHYVTERMNFAEQKKMDLEKQKKLEEDEEIRRIRRELVPIAQPMPYFDRPFVPKKSARPRTVPKEPRFHIRPLKSCAAVTRR